MCRDIAILEPLIKRCIPLPIKKLYKHARRRLRTIDEVEQYFPGFKAFIDSTEQEIPKPMNKRKRKSYYSGKKKKHTVKTQYMVNTKGLILHKTGYKKGRKHDYDIYKHIIILLLHHHKLKIFLTLVIWASKRTFLLL